MSIEQMEIFIKDTIPGLLHDSVFIDSPLHDLPPLRAFLICFLIEIRLPSVQEDQLPQLDHLQSTKQIKYSKIYFTIFMFILSQQNSTYLSMNCDIYL